MKKVYKKPEPPSRDKYDRAHPTVSARLPLATRDKLLAKLEALNMTLPEALKVLAGELEIKAKPIEEARNKGFQVGFQQAKKRYLVTFPCSECGKLVPITEPKAKAKIARYMSESGWKHSQCPK